MASMEFDPSWNYTPGTTRKGGFWIASLGEWSDQIAWDERTKHWRTFDNGTVGPFKTQGDAIAYLRQHSFSLGTDTENDPPLPDVAYAQYTHHVDPISAWVWVELGDEPGQFTPEGAAELLGDLHPELKNKEEK